MGTTAAAVAAAPRGPRTECVRRRVRLPPTAPASGTTRTRPRPLRRSRCLAPIGTWTPRMQTATCRCRKEAPRSRPQGTPRTGEVPPVG